VDAGSSTNRFSPDLQEKNFEITALFSTVFVDPHIQFIFIGNLGVTRCVGSALYDNCQVESISQGGGRGNRLVFGFYDEMSHKVAYRHDRMKRLRIPLVKSWLWNKSNTDLPIIGSLTEPLDPVKSVA
jgi:hypothetical protein